MVLSDEVKAARKAARQAATEAGRRRRAAESAEVERDEIAKRFGQRPTRSSVAKLSLTREEYDVAVEMGLAGPAATPDLRDPLDLRAAREWQGTDSLQEQSKRSATSHGHKNDPSYMAPDSYEPTPRELAARQRSEELNTLFAFDSDDQPDLADDEVSSSFRWEDDRYDEMAWTFDPSQCLSDADPPAEWETDNP